MKYDSKLSNSTSKIHTAFGRIISIKDYNQDEQIESCIKSDCLYVFNATLSIGSSKIIDINVTYSGGPNLNQ